MHSEKFTKIIATIGPASDDPKVIRELILAGVNIFRFNTKHNTNDWHKHRIILVREISRELGLPVGILVDLQGPEIRIETFEGQPIEVKKGEPVAFVLNFDDAPSEYDSANSIRIPDAAVFEALKTGDSFSIDDGFIDFDVVDTGKNYFLAHSHETAMIKTRKGLNLVGIDVALPSLTDNDRERLSMASETKVDFIALSFVRTKEDIQILRKEMDKVGLNARIVSKIESQKGVDNIEEILEVTDAIMVARGDLGIEIPIERVTHIQKELIKKCRAIDKQVIVATQMLESMINNPRPTRAEAADIANAVYDETDCTMLSGETAGGKYPLKAVETMRRIAKYNESHKPTTTHKPKVYSQTHLVVDAAMTIINERVSNRISKIIVFTETGNTARLISSFRPHIPVIAISDSDQAIGSLSMSYGVFPIFMKTDEEDTIYPNNIIKKLKSAGIIEDDETLVIIHGHTYKQSGSTNALAIIKA